MQRWVGKTAVVTGASVGIGAAIAVSLADAGMNVIAAARRLNKLEELQKRIKGNGHIYPYRCDVSVEKEIVALFEFAKRNGGGVDVLVNNAAMLPLGSITDYNGEGPSLKDVEMSFKINVLAVVTGTRLAIADMTSRKVPGHIITINSIAGHKVINLMQELPKSTVYGGTKYALTAINETLRLELGFIDFPIRTTSISPGAVDTDMLQSLISDLKHQIPMLKSQDIADAVVYALSVPQSVNITELTIQPTGERF